MSLEHLTKTQIILLALLASFVTSIATGIVTAALMSQAPQTVAQTVDQVIEKTVQQVVPPSQTADAAQEIVKTTVVTSKEAAPAAIATAEVSIIRIFAKDDPTRQIVARGIVVSATGAAQTASGAFTPGTAYEALLPNGSVAQVAIGASAASSSITNLTLTAASSTTWVPALMADPRALKLGESVVRISGASADVVGEGILAELPDAHTGLLQADVSSATPGAVLIDLSGAVIGMTTPASLSVGGTFYSALAPITP